MIVYNCYTDASTIGQYETASSGMAAILVNITDNRLIYSMGRTNDVDNCTVAELFAIRLGLFLSKSVVKEGDLLRICSDSLSAIEHVEGRTETENEDIGEITHFIQKILKTYPCDVQFQWVRAHSDHPMNDMADYIAYHHAQG
tara:strand:+ start:45 stop:473 length:429 start_codon:yes stop_codon:yes gene_type:complete